MTKIINLDAVSTEPDLAIVVDGKRHDMVKPTMQNFIDNMKLVEELGMNPSPVKEMESGIVIIRRAFPTITEKDLLGWTLERVQMLVDLARSSAGEIVTADSEEAASGNDLKAS
jgi:hypothetical protein